MKTLSIAFVTLFGLAGSTPSQAQMLGQYQPTADTLRYSSVNSYFLYFVRGADTAGTPVTTQMTESRKATQTATGLHFWVRLKGEGSSPFEVVQTYLVNPSGRVLQAGDQPVAKAPAARVDLLPRWPAPPTVITAGQTWNDTVAVEGTQPYGKTFYRVERAFRVLRIVDSLNTSLAQVRAEGTMSLRQGGWADQAQKQAWWQEVTGPVVDSIWFDIKRGTILQAVTVMGLAGTGGTSGGPVMPSGLRSTVRLIRQ